MQRLKFFALALLPLLTGSLAPNATPVRRAPELGPEPGVEAHAEIVRPRPAMVATAPDAAQSLTPAELEFSRLDELIYARLNTAPAATDAEDRCLAQAVYFEARSESLEGQLAVAQVVLNRVADPRYPDSVCGVVFQNAHKAFRCQFSFACDGLSDNPHNRQAWAIANAVAQVAKDAAWDDLVDASTHYHAVYVEPYWVDKLDRRVQVGRHIFYRDTSF